MRLARRQVLATLPTCAMLAALAGCHSAPPAQYYRLAPAPGATLAAPSGSVRVRGIFIPDYLDQNGIAEPSGAYQFAAAANALWAEPLGTMLQSVMVEDLTQRLPGMSVTGSNGAIGAPADLLVEINVLRFDPDASGRIFLTAQIGLRAAKDDRFLGTRSLQFSAPPTGAAMPDVMAAMSALWGELADALAQMIAQNVQNL